MNQDNTKKTEFRDRPITCYDCGTEFVLTAGEAVFYKNKSLSPPKRCRMCRQRRQATLVPDSEVQHGL